MIEGDKEREKSVPFRPSPTGEMLLPEKKRFFS